MVIKSYVSLLTSFFSSDNSKLEQKYKCYLFQAAFFPPVLFLNICEVNIFLFFFPSLFLVIWTLEMILINCQISLTFLPYR